MTVCSTAGRRCPRRGARRSRPGGRVKQYVGLIAEEKIAAPGNAEYVQNQSVKDFATGKAATLLRQAAGSPLKVHGMRPDAYGVAPMSPRKASGRGDRAITSALKFVQSVTSTPEQKVLNSA